MSLNILPLNIPLKFWHSEQSPLFLPLFTLDFQSMDEYNPLYEEYIESKSQNKVQDAEIILNTQNLEYVLNIGILL